MEDAKPFVPPELPEIVAILLRQIEELTAENARLRAKLVEVWGDE